MYNPEEKNITKALGINPSYKLDKHIQVNQEEGKISHIRDKGQGDIIGKDTMHLVIK